MTNQHRGEVSIELAGKTRNLRLTFGAMAEVEATLGRRVPDIFSDDMRFGVTELTVIIAAGLKHEDRKVTPKSVAKLMDASTGSLTYFAEKVGEAVKLVLGDKEESDTDDEEEDDNVHPLIGTNS